MKIKANLLTIAIGASLLLFSPTKAHAQSCLDDYLSAVGAAEETRTATVNAAEAQKQQTQNEAYQTRSDEIVFLQDVRYWEEVAAEIELAASLAPINWEYGVALAEILALPFPAQPPLLVELNAWYVAVTAVVYAGYESEMALIAANFEREVAVVEAWYSTVYYQANQTCFDLSQAANALYNSREETAWAEYLLCEQ